MSKEQDDFEASTHPSVEPSEPTAQSTVDALETAPKEEDPQEPAPGQPEPLQTAHGMVLDPAADRALQQQVDSQLAPEPAADLYPIPGHGDAEPTGKADPTEPPAKKKRGIRGIASWFENRAHSAISKVYQTQADDLEERAKRVVGSAYKEHSDDLEERAIRVLRKAISDEADRIKEAISHGVAVKKIEVRLSLFVLVVASLIYLGLYWFTQGGGSEG